MMRRITKFPRARLVALAVGAGVLGSFALSAAPAMANSPGGNSCIAGTSKGDPNGGKVSGSGSTFQAAAINTFIAEYMSDECGVVPSQYSGDPAGSAMITYNYPGAGSGSGAGQADAGCRADAWGGSDKPYTEALLHTDLDGAPGTGFTCPGNTYAAPYTPASPFPNPSDATQPVMAFPIAGGATALGFNLGPITCTGTAPTTLNLTSAEAEGIFEGTLTRWEDPTLDATNPGLSSGGCTGYIERATRAENSGTTSQFMTYLSHISTGTLCDGVNTWKGLAAKNPNNVWPLYTSTDNCFETINGTKYPAQAPVESTGTPGVINCVEGGTGAAAGCGDGSIGYGELGIWGTQAPSATLADLQTAASAGGTPVFISPGSGTAGSNCSFTSLGGLPGSKNGRDAVSLNPNGANQLGQGNNNWASDAPTNKSDFTYQGTNYPVCGLTWDFVYRNLSVGNGNSGDPFVGLTNNQRETLYTFFSYVFTTEGQAGLTGAGYDPLPVTWDSVIRGGIQLYF